MTTKYLEFTGKHIFELDNKTKEINFKMKYRQIKEDKHFRTIISLPFYMESGLTITEYKDKEKRALDVLNSKLKSKYKAIQKRDSENRAKYQYFLDFIDKADNSESKKLYLHDLNHKENDDTIGDIKLSQIRTHMVNFQSENYEEIININFLSWEKFIEIMVSDSCSYCGISIEQINKLSEKQQLFTKRARGYSMEVDQINSYDYYTNDNCVASCYWCNNAKTDEFSFNEFKDIAKGIKAIWSKRLEENKND